MSTCEMTRTNKRIQDRLPISFPLFLHKSAGYACVGSYRKQSSQITGSSYRIFSLNAYLVWRDSGTGIRNHAQNVHLYHGPTSFVIP